MGEMPGRMNSQKKNPNRSAENRQNTWWGGVGVAGVGELGGVGTGARAKSATRRHTLAYARCC